MRALIVEDEPRAARRLVRLLGECAPEITVVGTVDSVEKAVQWLRSGPAPDVLFLDIQLTDGSSFDIFEQVEVSAPVVFCTAYDEHALRAFDVNGIAYLLKPIEPARLASAVDRARQIHAGRQSWADVRRSLARLAGDARAWKTRFLVREGVRLVAVPVDRIAHFHTQLKIVRLVTVAGREHAVEYTLDDLEQALPPQRFFRVNRQVIVSLAGMRSARERGHRIVLDLAGPPGQTTVSRERTSSFREWLDR